MQDATVRGDCCGRQHHAEHETAEANDSQGARDHDRQRKSRKDKAFILDIAHERDAELIHNPKDTCLIVEAPQNEEQHDAGAGQNVARGQDQRTQVITAPPLSAIRWDGSSRSIRRNSSRGNVWTAGSGYAGRRDALSGNFHLCPARVANDCLRHRSLSASAQMIGVIIGERNLEARGRQAPPTSFAAGNDVVRALPQIRACSECA